MCWGFFFAVPVTSMLREKIMITHTSQYDALFLNGIIHFKKEMLIDRIDEWIVRAKEQVEAILPSYPTPVIVVASNKDEMFDSNTEAKRLSENIPKSQIVHVTGCGHLILEERFPLSVVINTFL